MTEEDFEHLKLGDVIEWRFKDQSPARFVFISYRSYDHYGRPARATPWAIALKDGRRYITDISWFPENWHLVDEWKDVYDQSKNRY